MGILKNALLAIFQKKGFRFVFTVAKRICRFFVNFYREFAGFFEFLNGRQILSQNSGLKNIAKGCARKILPSSWRGSRARPFSWKSWWVRRFWVASWG
jgi:hypothetical protein